MLSRHLQKLLSISGDALCKSKPDVPASLIDIGGGGTDQLVELLQDRNGFYAFESALHVLPSDCVNSAEQAQLNTWPMDLEQWNTDALWRNQFGPAANGLLFFAEDAFGEQFALFNGTVWRFDPESAERKEVAGDLDAWAEMILSDYSFETGYPAAHDWQQQNGPLNQGQRLIPKVPFIMGGKYEADNLFALDAVEGMRYRGDIWKQIRDLPDGTRVQLTRRW